MAAGGPAHELPHLRHQLFQVIHLFDDDGQLLAGLIVEVGKLEELPGEAAHDQQRVFDFMGDVGHGIAHGGQALGLEHPLFHLLVFGHVPDDAGEIEIVANLGHGKGDADGEFAAVPALGREADVLADYLGLPGGDVAPHVVPVIGLVGRRNDDVQVLAQGLLPGIAEHLFGALDCSR